MELMCHVLMKGQLINLYHFIAYQWSLSIDICGEIHPEFAYTPPDHRIYRPAFNSNEFSAIETVRMNCIEIGSTTFARTWMFLGRGGGGAVQGFR